MGNVDTSTTRKEKHLRLTLSANLKVSQQCGTAAVKVNRILGLIRRDYYTIT